MIRILSICSENIKKFRAYFARRSFLSNNLLGAQVPEDEEEELPPPPPVATRPERTKSIYTRPLEEPDHPPPVSPRLPPPPPTATSPPIAEANANGAALDSNRNPQQATAPTPVTPAAAAAVTTASPTTTAATQPRYCCFYLPFIMGYHFYLIKKTSVAKSTFLFSSVIAFLPNHPI